MRKFSTWELKKVGDVALSTHDLGDKMRRIGPLGADHPMVIDGTECPACKEKFITGDYVALITLGPGKDPEAREKAAAGKPYTAVAVPVHWDCAEHPKTT